MGFSLAAAAAIIGVALLISLELIVGTTIPTITDVHEAYDDMKDRSIDQIQTDIKITNAVYVLPNTLISVDNNGSTTINSTNCNVLLNGVSKTFTCTLSHIHPEQTAIFSFAQRAELGDIIKIITPNGVSDYHEF